MRIAGFLFAASILLAPIVATAQPLRDAIQARGTLVCGVSQGTPGFSQPDSRGVYQGLDADFCRAVAAAVIGRNAPVRFVGLSTQTRFTALQSGEIDLLARDTTWTSSRDATLGIEFVGTLFYDGQAFLARRSVNARTLRDLDGATLCISPGSTMEANAVDAFRRLGTRFQPLVAGDTAARNEAFLSGRCDVMTDGASTIAAMRVARGLGDTDFALLPEIISREPYAPAVRLGDDAFRKIVRWTLYGLFQAEEFGLTRANVDQMAATTTDPAMRRFLGVEAGMGQGFGLRDSWLRDVIATVGNYGEIFANNLGDASPFRLPRGQNALWRDGGLHYAPPFR